MLNLPSYAQNNSISWSNPLPHDFLNSPDEILRLGEIEVTPVKSPLDDRFLFDIASPTVFNRDKIVEDHLPVEVRAQIITGRLWRIAYRSVTIEATPIVMVNKINHRFVIQVKYEAFSRPLDLITVTDQDSNYNGQTPEILAIEWQKILHEEIYRLKEITSPKALYQRLWRSFYILVTLMLITIAIVFLWKIVSKKQKQLPTNTSLEVIEQSQVHLTGTSNLQNNLLLTLQRQFKLRKQLEDHRFLKWMLLWVLILVWYVGIYAIMSQVPILMRWSRDFLSTPLFLILFWFVISLGIRISNDLIDRFIYTWEINPSLPMIEAQRLVQRTTTISIALKGVITFGMIIIGIIWSLSLFDIPTGSILAGGALIGVVISFGSQNLIKDLVNGFLILTEDQFAVGDIIQVGDKTGVVENLNLRVTQLRNREGQLLIIPNSNITAVNNLTRSWSQVDFSIMVAYENPPQQVMAILQQVAEELYHELEWHKLILEPPQVLGIEDLSSTGMLMRVLIKTLPMEKWKVGRELRLRVRQAFEVNNITMSTPVLFP